MIMITIIIILNVATQLQKRCLGILHSQNARIYIYIHLIGGSYVPPTSDVQ